MSRKKPADGLPWSVIGLHDIWFHSDDDAPDTGVYVRKIGPMYQLGDPKTGRRLMFTYPELFNFVQYVRDGGLDELTRLDAE